MKNFFKHIFLITFFLGMALAGSCSHYKNDNPYDVLYPDANYFLKCEWKCLPEILYIDTIYSLPCSTSSDQDTFLYIDADDIDSGFVAINKVHSDGFDTLSIRFKKEHAGIIHVRGMRPNGKYKYDSSGSLTVINQYKPIVSVQKEKIVIRGVDTIPVIVSNLTDSIVTVYWRLGSSIGVSLLDTFRLDTMNIVVNTAESDTVDTLFVWARNSIGYASDTVKSVLKILSYIPAIRAITIPDTIFCGDTLSFNVKVDSINAYFKAVVTDNTGRYTDTSGLYHYYTNVNISMRRPFVDTGKVILHLYLIDSLELFKSDIITDSMYVRYSLPALYIQPSIEVPVNRSIDISVIDSHSVAVKYMWMFSNGALSNTTDSSFISKNYPSVISDTVTVYAVNKYNYTGNTVKSVISARPMKYFLSAYENIFPSNVTARRSTGLSVTLDSTSLFEANKGLYRWRIDSAGITVLDTVKALPTIKRFFADSGVYLASIIAYDTLGDSSNLLKRIIVAHRYIPGCKFKKTTDTAFVNEWDTVKLHCWDSNPDTSGHISNIFWKLNPSMNFESGTSADSAHPILYQTLGDHIFYAYAKDNDGFVSAIDSMQLAVLSYQPYRNTLVHDTVIYIGSTLLMRVDFHMGIEETPIINYFWRISGTDNFNTTTTMDTLSWIFSKEGIDTVIVNCFDQNAKVSVQPDTFIVTIAGNLLPVVNGFAPDTVWIKDTNMYTVTATSLKSGVQLTKYMISWDNSSNFIQYSDKSSTYCFNTSGNQRIRLYVADTTGDESVTINDSVFVRLGKPVIDSVAINAPQTDIFVLKSQNYSVYSSDSNGAVDSIKIIWSSSDISTQIATLFPHIFTIADTGIHAIRILVRDNDGIWSDTMNKQINIRLAKPVIKSFKSDSVVYTSTKRRFTVSATDSVGKIDSVIMFIGKNAVYLKDSTFDTSFSTAGVRYVKIIAKNDRKMLTDTLNDSIVVNNWKPWLTSAYTDMSMDSIFVLDTHWYTFKGRVNFGRIRQIKISWKGTNVFTDSMQANGDSAKFKHVFLVTDTSIKAVMIRLVDTNSQIVDSLIPIKIRYGKPVIDNISPRMLWVNDDTTFNITAHDTNGSVDSLIVDWGDGTGQIRKGLWDIIKHKYAIAQAGLHTLKIIARDNDGFFSDTVSFVDSVHSGKPVMQKIMPNDSMVWLTGLTYDTLVCPFRAATGTTTIGAGSYDTNGSVVKFFWDLSNGLSYDTTKINLLSTTKLNINQAYSVKISGKDDDSIATSSSFQFYVWPHTPPAALSANCEVASDSSRKISWSGKDQVDSNATLYKVIIKKDSKITVEDETNPVYIIQNFTAGTQCTSGSPSFDYSLTFTPNQGSGYYYWQIIAKNSRGQQSRNSGTPTFSFGVKK